MRLVYTSRTVERQATEVVDEATIVAVRDRSPARVVARQIAVEHLSYGLQRPKFSRNRTRSAPERVSASARRLRVDQSTIVSSSTKPSGGWPQCGQTLTDSRWPASGSSIPTPANRATRSASADVTGFLQRGADSLPTSPASHRGIVAPSATISS